MSNISERKMEVGLFEEHFRCCICLDVYKEPVSIPCGHNFCLDCIEAFWDTRSRPECPLCKETFTPRPVLRINPTLAHVIGLIQRGPEQEDAADAGSSQQRAAEAERVLCDVCEGTKQAAVKSCLTCQASYCELHLASHRRDAAMQRHGLSEPATFPARHLCRSHDLPLNMFCRKERTPVCSRCCQGDHRDHKVVSMRRESRKLKALLKQSRSDIQQLIEERLTKAEELKHSVDQSKKSTEREIEDGVQICDLLVSAIERQKAALVEELQQRQQEVERREQQLLDELQQELQLLQGRSARLQQLEHTQNPLHLLQSFPSACGLPPCRDWSQVAALSDPGVGSVRRAVERLVDVCRGLANALSAKEAEQVKEYAADVTLDPSTASEWLVLSADRKEVSLGSQRKVALPSSPLRFDSCVCILGKQSFTSGRHYFEVKVGDKTDWDLGVARESINRKGAITVRPDSGYWAVCRRRGGSVSACAGPTVALHLKQTPKKVGVFLDYEEGVVSFYDPEAKTHVFTYSGCSFTEALHPYLNPCVQENGKNAVPLIVCSVAGLSV